MCPSDKICNPLTSRCVLKTGKIGMKLISTKRLSPCKKKYDDCIDSVDVISGEPLTGHLKNLNTNKQSWKISLNKHQQMNLLLKKWIDIKIDVLIDILHFIDQNAKSR